ncbi:MAG: hypothetical protein FD129_3023, partial [bacterium]
MTRTSWSFYASAYTYILPDEADYLQPTFLADRGSLHLEARYNYEDLETVSLRIGYNMSTGDDPSLAVTAMLGGVFGQTSGIAPGYRMTLAWGIATFDTEGEYLFDAETMDDSFFYSWSELTAAPVDWMTAGLVMQRTRANMGPREFQRGFLLGVAFERVDLTGYLFNPDDADPTWVVAVGVGFGAIQ